MAKGFLKDQNGVWHVITNTILDSTSTPQTANEYLLDVSSVSHRVFYGGALPTSLLPGASRRFDALGKTRVFEAQGHTRIFES